MTSKLKWISAMPQISLIFLLWKRIYGLQSTNKCLECVMAAHTVHTVTHRVRLPECALWPQCSVAHGAQFVGPLEGRNLGDSCLPLQGTKPGTYVSQFSYFLLNSTLKYLHTNIHKHTHTTKPPNTPANDSLTPQYCMSSGIQNSSCIKQFSRRIY